MAISFWKCLDKKNTRPKFRSTGHSRNITIPKQSRCHRRLKFQRGVVLTMIMLSLSYQNSYHLDAKNPFKTDPVDEIVKDVMEMRLEDITYDAATAPKLCTQIAQEIRKKVTKLEFDRCKIVVIVTMIEKGSQGVNSKLGFVWDVDRDNYASYNFETPSFYAYCLVVGAYYE